MCVCVCVCVFTCTVVMQYSNTVARLLAPLSGTLTLKHSLERGDFRRSAMPLKRKGELFRVAGVCVCVCVCVWVHVIRDRPETGVSRPSFLPPRLPD